MQIHLNLHSLNSLISFPPDITGKSRKKNDWGLKYFVYKIGGKWAVSWWSGFCFFSSWISRWELPNYTSYILLSPIFHSESCLFQLSSLSRPSVWPSDFFSAKENQKVARHYKTFKIIRKKIKKNHWLHVFIYIASFSSSIQLTTSIFVTAEIKVANSLFQQRTFLFYATSYFYKRKFACL